MISRRLFTPVALGVAVLLSAPSAWSARVDMEPGRLRFQADDAGLTDRVIVKYRHGSGAYPTATAAVSMRVAANRQGVRVEHLRAMAGGAQVFRANRRMTRGEAETLAASLRAGDPNVEFAEPDRVLQPLFVPNDSLYAQQWSLSDATAGIRAPAAWDNARGTGVTVAVIDTGVRPHADLKANLLAGHDFIADPFVSADGNGRDADAQDPGDAVGAGYCGSGSPAGNSSWHGTHVAGIVAAAGGNAQGVAGVAFGAKLLPLRALGRCGGYTSDIADAIVWAAGGAVSGLPTNTTPAKVINLSLGGTGACDQTTQNAIHAARAKGAVVIVAAGNSNVDAANTSPASCAGVIAVAATGKTGGKAAYSNYGAKVSLAAPGGDSGAGILSTLNAGTGAPGADSYAAYMGTSMAAPVVSGVAALVLSVNPALTPDQVATVLKSTARAFPAPCGSCGAGLVDAAAAVAKARAMGGTAPSPAPAPAPAPTPAPPPAPAPAPAPAGTVAEKEPNSTLATAQVLGSVPVTVSGGLSIGDNDHFRVSIPAGKKLIVTLKGASTAALGLGVYLTSGQQLLLMSGATGQSLQVAISNGGSVASSVILRAVQNGGAAGAYQLVMGY